MKSNLRNFDDGRMAAHMEAFENPKGAERGIIALIKGWASYAGLHFHMNGEALGNDYFLGDEWAMMAKHIRQLLNGDLGRLDGGMLDRFICFALEAEGFDPDTFERIKE